MNVVTLFKNTFSQFGEDKGPRLAAALSYYSIFALAPLVLIAIFIAGLFLSQSTATGTIRSTVSSVLGPGAANALLSFANNRAVGSGGIFATVAGVVALLLGATGVFVALQQSLNQIWNVEPKKAGIGEVIRQRLTSFLLIFAIGILLILAILASTVVSFISSFFSGILPGGSFVWQAVNFVVTWIIIAILFGLIFKILPDVNIPWRIVWIGAIITSFLFNVGKLLISLYLGHSSIASSYGAAGSLVLILVFIYYSALIFFFGAELTQVYAQMTGEEITPARGAHWASEGGAPQLPSSSKPAKRQQARGGRAAPQAIPATGGHRDEAGSPDPVAFTSSEGYLADAQPEPPRGFYGLMAAGVVAVTGGVLAAMRLTGSKK